ncbi:MAG: (S)-2,3-epoxysqualene cyclase, partial [Bacteroidota bacterium]|nr:(S)-2,3-epoxysqualene cyclase [Bacteroidota bacterium]
MDYSKSWKLKTDYSGRQLWAFSGLSETSDIEKKHAIEANSSDLIYRSQQQPLFSEKVSHSTDPVFKAAFKAINYYQSLQADSGHWPGDYGGPLFLTPGLVMASYVTETPLPAQHQELIKQYFLNHQNTDGGWGLHIEGGSTMFGTVLQYVSLRILGMNANHSQLENAKRWIGKNGGATAIPAWGKFYLSVLGVYEWKGVNSLLPEMCLLPEWLPIHPSHYWCHARMVYLPMAYCFSHKIVGKATPLVEELRAELYTEDYKGINWIKARNNCAVTDLYFPQSTVLKSMNKLLNFYEKFPLKSWRNKATKYILEYIKAEDEQTNFIDIGPVNQAINSICIWHSNGKDSPAFKKHVERWYDYLWIAEDGMKMNGYNGSQLWDTAFATQAIMEGGFEKHFPDTVCKAFKFIDTSQIKEEVPRHREFFRHDSVGGWPFSTVEHGWPITDCTAEGLKVAIKVAGYGQLKVDAIPEYRLKQACDLILSLQNKDGGWASYELMRGPKWLELLNPSEIFGNIMIDYSYTDCSSASLQALMLFLEDYPGYRRPEIIRAI